MLGSGGARGLAHIGVIRWLHEHHYKINAISGCSMGALIGGVYAANKLDDFEHWARAISKLDIISLLDISWQKTGLVKGDKIINTLTNLVGDLMIEDLAIKYTAVAADIVNEKEVWINSGRLFDAIRASISLPLFFTPFNLNGVELIDGGVLNPVPIAPTFGDNSDITIAVNLGGPIEEKPYRAQQVNQPISEDISFANRITEFIDNLTGTANEKVKESWGAYDIANQAFDAMQSTISRQKLAAYPADYTIEVARNACGTLEFDLANDMIELGYKKAQQVLGES